MWTKKRKWLDSKTSISIIYIFLGELPGEVNCLQCNDGYFNLNNQCKDRCDIFNPSNSGCGPNEECMFIEEGYAKCKCLIPDEQVDKNSCECDEGSFVNGECLNICKRDDDCSGGKCVILPGNIYKTCLCPIDK